MSDDEQGQVSEVGAMDPDDADTPISPDQSIAGAPDAESGDVDESTIGSHKDPEAEVERSKH